MDPLSPPVPGSDSAAIPPWEIDARTFANEGALSDALATVWRAIIECLANGAAIYDECGRVVLGSIVSGLEAHEDVYQRVGDMLDARILGILGFPNVVAEQAGLPEISPGEIRGRAALLPMPMQALPVVPKTTPGTATVLPQPLPRTAVPGTTHTVPSLPTFPPSMLDRLREMERTRLRSTEDAPIQPPRPGPSVPDTAVRRRVGGHERHPGNRDVIPGDTGPLHARPGPSGPAPGGREVTPDAPSESQAALQMLRGSTRVNEPTSGGVSPLLRGANRGSDPTHNRLESPPNGGSGGDGGAVPPDTGTRPQTADCPPVNVVIHCAPGVTAAVVPPQGAGGDGVATPPASSFVSEDLGYVEKLTPAEHANVLARRRTEQLWDRIQYTWQTLKDAKRPLDVCATAPELRADAQKVVEAFWTLLTGSKDGSVYKPDSIVEGQLTGVPEWLQNLLRPVIRLVVGGAWMAQETAGAVTGCDADLYHLLTLGRSAVGFLTRWVGADLGDTEERLKQISGQICAVILPDPGAADAAYIRDGIDDKLWECWVRAGGVDPGPARLVRDSQEVRPNADQLVEALRRLQVPEDKIGPALRWIGVLSEQSADAFVVLSRYVPGPGDLISFMTRDVFDQDVIDRYGYDSEFSEKWVGKAKEWGYAQGLTEEQALYYWRAHWQLPGNAAAEEMLHRLRPGRVDDKLVTKAEDILKLYEINDIPLYFRERFMAISYAPLRRVDIRRAFFIGALTVDETLDAIMDLGYDDRNAGLLLRYWKRERLLWLQNQRPIREFSQGAMPESELRAQLERMGFQGDDMTSALGVAGLARSSRDVQVRSKAIRNQVLRGLLDSEDAKEALRRIGYAPWDAADRVAVWEDERKAKGKHATGAQLCEWWGNQWLTDDEYVEALARVGYSPSQIALIMRTCREKAGARAKQKLKMEAAARAKEESQGAKKEASEEKKQALVKARSQRATNMLRRAEERVQMRLQGACVHLSAKVQATDEDACAQVAKWFKALVEGKGYTRDGAAQMIAGVVADHAGKEGRKWREAGDEFVDLLPLVVPADSEGG